MPAWLTRRRIFWLALALAALLAALWLSLRSLQTAPAPQLIIAVPTQLSGGSMYLGVENKIFEKHGVRVKLRPFTLGKQALESALNGNSDLALLADTPLALAILRGEPLAVLATIYESPRALAVVARKDRGIQHGQDLAGRQVGTAFGTNAQRFLDFYLNELGLGNAAVRVTDLAPDHLVTALDTGAVDAVTLWYPDRVRAANQLPGKLLQLQPHQSFPFRFVLAGRPGAIAANQAAMPALLRALQEINASIAQDPRSARTLIAKAVGIRPDDLGDGFQASDYVLHLKPDLVSSLQDQARWAMKRGILPSAPLPDFRKNIDSRYLTAVSEQP